MLPKSIQWKSGTASKLNIFSRNIIKMLLLKTAKLTRTTKILSSLVGKHSCLTLFNMTSFKVVYCFSEQVSHLKSSCFFIFVFYHAKVNSMRKGTLGHQQHKVGTHLHGSTWVNKMLLWIFVKTLLYGIVFRNVFWLKALYELSFLNFPNQLGKRSLYCHLTHLVSWF